MSETVRLGLPLIAAAQAQKHVTHNEAMVALDALTCLSVADRDLADPPAEAAEGAAYIVAAPASGDWAGEEGRIAFRLDGGWRFYDPVAGLTAHVADEGLMIVYDGTGWIGAGGGVSELQNLALLGLGTEADATNPFSAVLNTALWAARRTADGGDGNLRCTMSKEGAANVLSLLFQTDFSARAEVGLIGGDDLVFKVSPDGASWTEALRLEGASGRASFPAGIAGTREMLAADRTYYVRTDGSDANDGLSGSAGGAFASIQKAVDTALALDFSIHDVTIQVGPGTYAAGAAIGGPWGGSGTLTLRGDVATPGNVVLDTPGACINITGALPADVTLEGFKLTSAANSTIAHSGSGWLRFRDIEFGAAALRHMSVGGAGAKVRAIGDYAISGDAQVHAYVENGGYLQVNSMTVTLLADVAFSQRFAYATRTSGILANATTFDFGGFTVMGQRYVVSVNSWIVTAGGGEEYFPGSAAGSSASGGQYS